MQFPAASVAVASSASKRIPQISSRTSIVTPHFRVVGGARIAEDLLTLARSDARSLPLEINAMDIGAVTAHLLRQYRSVADARGITLKYAGIHSTPIEAMKTGCDGR